MRLGHLRDKIKQPTFLRNQDLRISLALGLGVGLIYLAFLPPGIYSIDGNSMLAVSESLVTRHNFSVPPSLGSLGRDGYYYSRWYPLLSILAVPFVAIGLALGHLLSLPAHHVAAVCALVLPALLTAGTTSLVVLLALRLGSTRRSACLAALGFALGTVALVYAGKFFAEPLLAFLTVASLYFALGETKRESIATGVLASLAVMAKPTGVIVGPILSAYLLTKRRPLHIALVPLFGTSMGLILYGIYNNVRFGNPQSFRYPHTFEAPALPEGFLGLLISPGRGLLWYCPPVVLSVIALCKAIRSKALEALMIVTLFIGYLLLHSFGKFWSGGWSWGPRFLLPALPGLLALTGLVEKQWRKGLLILTVIGFIVNAPTLVSFYERYYDEAKEQGISYRALLWSPTHAPLIHAWGAAQRQISDALAGDVKDLVRKIGTPESKKQMLRVVSVWWWMLPAFGIPRWVGVALAFLFVGIGVWVMLKALLVAQK
ncbi:MAG: hypothetical protein HWN51_06655 [Desulfobacterales bacterium]|nr:hypothetical protein [Desulfobacterales bacterium]